ncbi:MAG: glycoside hydrolase family 2, partial [Clostridia bacterium]|nr:glycoside hydrolase family 2 [Clostridia bacterium]
MSKRKNTVPLITPYEEDLKESALPFYEYPRPAFRRDSYFCLNGEWDFSVECKGVKTPFGRITVPFPPESRLSRIERVTEQGDTLHYTRSFTLPEGFRKDRVLLHFGAVDQVAKVYLNGTLVAEHVGGYLPFSADVTPFLREEENILAVEVTDPLDTDLPYGKQSRK